MRRWYSKRSGEARQAFMREEDEMIAADGGLLTGFGEDQRAVVRKRMEAMKAGHKH